MKKTIYVAVIVAVLVISLVALDRIKNMDTLNGTYKSQSGDYEVQFKRDGSFVWKRGGAYLNGTYESGYEKGAQVFQLHVYGKGWDDGFYKAYRQGRDILIKYQSRDEQLFVK